MSIKSKSRFFILGPITVWRGGQEIPIGSCRERFVLGMLLLNAGRLTPANRLIDALWDDPPRSARAQLHNTICNLRRRLQFGGDDLIATRSTGYEVRIDGHDLDLLRFRRLVERGRRAGAAGDHALSATMLANALSLWRGPALSDLPDRLAAAPRQVLHEEMLDAAEARCAAQLALGRHDDAVRGLGALIGEDPYRERLHELRMIALAGTGRRAEALVAYRHLYRRLTDDLGIEPGPSLRRLHQRILADQLDGL